jgi:tRNA threonylcarbamoyladenosine biosynthesis protein TsaB
VVKLVRESRLASITFTGLTAVNVLALDTSTRAGSVAIVRDSVIIYQRTDDSSRTHGERLPTGLMRVVDDARLTPQSLDMLAVAAGPGSFTGLRVGIAAIQGLAMALGRRVVPVSTLEALARAGAANDGEGDAGIIAPWLDAQRGEVFAAVYAADGRTRLSEPTALPPGPTLDALRRAAGRIRVIGDGAVRYADQIAAHLGDRAEVVRDVPLLAAIIGQIACESPERAVAPHAVAPVYVRRPDAELARERRSR